MSKRVEWVQVPEVEGEHFISRSGEGGRLAVWRSRGRKVWVAERRVGNGAAELGTAATADGAKAIAERVAA
jgi:hypothetical protein